MADGFNVTDRRRSHRGMIITGQSVEQAKRDVSAGTPASAAAALARGREGPVDPDAADLRNMRAMRQRTGAMSGNYSLALGQPRDLMFYWQQRNLPYDLSKVDEMTKLRALCRIIYATHPVMASAIDIFSKYPLVGMEFTCKDEELTQFYSTLMFDQLDYEDYLIDVGREYWTVGEAWPLGSFNESLGVWEADELINPDDVSVETSPFLRDPRFEIKLPQTLRNVLQSRQPANEYRALINNFPELVKFANDPQAKMSVSSILLKQLRFKGDTFNKRGVPIMLRGLRAVMQEEMLNAAQDAIAERLYTPLILARLGASASDLGTQQPWIPNDNDLAAFEDALDTALSADFRVLTHHFALQMDSVFGRETMPDFGADFDRLMDRQLQVFGMSRTLLTGSSQGETYAADALNRDLISQLLTTYQRMLKRLTTDRMLVVAEAQQHYDYELRAGQRYPIMEEVLEVDEETGEEHIVEQPKLLVPDIQMKTMNIRDEQGQQAFLEALHEGGVPISMRRRLVNIPVDLNDEMEQSADEQVELAVKQQETRKRIYTELKAKNLPIEEDLLTDFEPKALNPGEPSSTAQGQPASPPTRVPTLGIDPAAIDTTLDPSQQVLEQPPGAPLADPASEGPGGTVVPLPTNSMQQSMRPPESDEQRATMPKASALHIVDPESGEEVTDPEVPGRLELGPAHIGMRREAVKRGLVDKDKPLPEKYKTDARIRRAR